MLFTDATIGAAYGAGLLAFAILAARPGQRAGWFGFGLSSLLVGTLLYALAIPDPPRYEWWQLAFSLPGARTGALAMLRVVGLFALGVIAARWIQPRDYMPWVGRRPRRLYIVSSMLRLIPLLRDDLERIRLSQAARGHEPSRGWLRAGGFMPILVPLFVSTLRRAREQAIAMELAGLNPKRSR